METKTSWHAISIDEVLNLLKSNASEGLSHEEAVSRQLKYGENKLPRGRQTQWWEFLLRQFLSPLVYILLIAAALTSWLREWADTAVILLSVIVNTAIGFYQEFEANKLLEKLKNIVRIEAIVVRQGHPRVIDSSELTPGDIIMLKSGMKIPADARLVEAHHLRTNEAILTGESAAVKKSLEAVTKDANLGDRSSMVWMGTVVEEGDGRAIVVATGAATEIGRIAALSIQGQSEPTPLQERLAKLANVISIVVGVSAIGIVILGLIEHLSFVQVFETAVAVAVAAIPEGLVAALTVVLAVSTSRILKRQGLVRRPIAAETLGSTTIICADKTGTLTEGVMKVEELFADGSPEDAHLILAFANEAIIEKNNDDKLSVRGESTDKAKLEYALAHGVDMAALSRQYITRAFVPFDMKRKYLASFKKTPAGAVKCFVSGAPEAILMRSVERGGGGLIEDEARKKIMTKVESFANQGYRLVALADKTIADDPALDDGEELHRFIDKLTYRGLVVIRDPIRPDVAETLRRTRGAGVRVMMITGDHRLTAQTIGQELGFKTGKDNVIDGAFLDMCSDEDLQKYITNVDICARVNPEHKLRVVKALKANGESVAMTGDGINDAPALEAADIGVAVGSAVDVTKEAADLVLLNDSLTTISSAIEEGRIAFDNIRKVATLLLSGSFTVFLLVVGSLILAVPLPLTAVQILWSNLVEHGLPTFALAFETGETDVMQRRPLKRTDSIFDSVSKLIVFGIAPLRDLLLMSIFLLLYWYANYPIEHIRTIIFAMVSTDSLLYIFSIKSFKRPLWRVNFVDNRYLLVAISLGLSLIVAAIYTPFLNKFLATVPLSVGEVFFVLSLAALDIILIEIVKIIYRQKRITPAPLQILQT